MENCGCTSRARAFLREIDISLRVSVRRSSMHETPAECVRFDSTVSTKRDGNLFVWEEKICRHSQTKYKVMS